VRLPDIDSETAAELATRLGFTLDDPTRVSDEVNAELPSFHAAAEQYAPALGSQDIDGFTFDPGPDADPLNAFISTFDLSRQPSGPLDDVDIGIKDNMAIAGVPMTSGSRVFETAISTRNAAVVDRLLDDGATIVGKTNMDELAYGPTSETSDYGPVPNPVDTDHVAGGSSSGSAAAVGAGVVEGALGSDTGGSIRMPASFCGVVGFKPTWGVVPRSGFVDLAYTLDHIGPIARDVETAARIFDSIRGYDPADPTSSLAGNLPDGNVTDAVRDPPALDDLVFGVPSELVGDQLTAGVAEAFTQARSALEDAGAELREVSIPRLESTVTLFNTIAPVELALNFLARAVPAFKRVSYDAAWQEAAAAAIESRGAEFGDIVQRKTVLGTYVLQEGNGRHYTRARNECARLTEDVHETLESVDFLLAPTNADTAPELGEWQSSEYSSDDSPPISVNTRPADLAGVPSLTVPSGDVDGLPVGIQVLGEKFRDGDVLAAGRAIEDCFDVQFEPAVSE
jgi:amidase/aspartyl-tRNA(Asn)/glutamyl-tRNA(Gln) amidotransferase subunit A